MQLVRKPQSTVESSPVVKEPDFTYERINFVMGLRAFCMRCGREAEFNAKSKSLGFHKKICADCVEYYKQELNA